MGGTSHPWDCWLIFWLPVVLIYRVTIGKMIDGWLHIGPTRRQSTWVIRLASCHGVKQKWSIVKKHSIETSVWTHNQKGTFHSWDEFRTCRLLWSAGLLQSQIFTKNQPVSLVSQSYFLGRCILSAGKTSDCIERTLSLLGSDREWPQHDLRWSDDMVRPLSWELAAKLQRFKKLGWSHQINSEKYFLIEIIM